MVMGSNTFKPNRIRMVKGKVVSRKRAEFKTAFAGELLW